MAGTHMKLDVPSETLAALLSGIRGFAFSSPSSGMHLRTTCDTYIGITVSSLAVAPMFEVFTLKGHAESAPGNCNGRWAAWPFNAWRSYVLTREEYVTPAGLSVQAIGRPANSQDAVLPGCVPSGATDSCIVEAGILFHGGDRGRFLIAVDWMPFHLIISRDEQRINDFLESCALTPLEDYLQNRAT